MRGKTILILIALLTLTATEAFCPVRFQFTKNGEIDSNLLYKNIEYVYDYYQPIKHTVYSIVPTAGDVKEGGIALYNSGTAYRQYSLINGTVVYLPFTYSNLTQFTGDITISSRPCAYFAYHLSHSSLTPITANTFTVLCGTGTMVSAAWFGTTVDTEGNSNRIMYRGANTHIMAINASGCVGTDAGTATTPMIRIYQNGSPIPLAENSPYLSVQNQDTAFSISCQASMVTNSYIEIWGTTSDGDDLEIDNCTITIAPID